MFNPSYLIKSRHDVYYFRYPLPTQGNKQQRLNLSLKTKCPNTALRYSRALQYHTENLMDKLDCGTMKHIEIKEILTRHFRDTLKMLKSKIDSDGCLPEDTVRFFNEYIKMMPQYERDEIECVGDYFIPHEQTQLYQSLQVIMKKYNLDFAPDSAEYAMLKKEHKHARHSLYQEALEYSQSVHNYKLGTSTTNSNIVLSDKPEEPQYTLSKVIEKYLEETKEDLSAKSLEDKRDLLSYLFDCFGENKAINSLAYEDARQVKENLRYTPTNRNKHKQTRGKPLLEQIQIAKDIDLKVMSTVSVNKYIGRFISLFSWAKNNKYVKENIFEGMLIKQAKKQNDSREHFTKEEIKIVLNELESNTHKTITNKSQYWGALLCIYTGARKNEITSLTVDDVKQDNNIWYIEITDTDGKSLKTKASKRLVPIHSKLIELGFLDFLQQSRQYKQNKPLTGGKTTRLLHDFTYTDKGQWGRKLGYFFNEGLLKSLGLYQKNKKVLHSLRHSFVTYLGTAQVDASIIQSIVGHEQSTVTHSTYTHYGLDYLPQFKEAIEKLGY